MGRNKDKDIEKRFPDTYLGNTWLENMAIAEREEQYREQLWCAEETPIVCPVIENNRKCECGVDSSGGGFHSKWCPKVDK